MDPKYYSVPEQRPNGGSPQGVDYAPVPPVQPSQVPVQPTYTPAQPSYSPAHPVYRPVPSVQTPAPRRAACRPAGTRDLVFAGILAVLCILAANFYLWGGLGLAASVVTVLIFLTGASYLLKHRRKITGYSIYCGLAYVIGAGAFLISDGGFLHFLRRKFTATAAGCGWLLRYLFCFGLLGQIFTRHQYLIRCADVLRLLSK